jgi:phage portal protein BeeE
MTSFEFYETMMFHAVLTGNALCISRLVRQQDQRHIAACARQRAGQCGMSIGRLTYNVSDLEGNVTTYSRPKTFCIFADRHGIRISA